jgi:phage baseplate assembly protein W
MASGGRILGRGIAFPPRVGADGRIAWSEGEANVEDSIRVILQTDRDERLRLPEFGAGLKRYLFEPNTVATRHQIESGILRALAAWEPRIAIDAVDVEPDPNDAEAAIATIRYKLVATQAPQRMTLAVTLGG